MAHRIAVATESPSKKYMKTRRYRWSSRKIWCSWVLWLLLLLCLLLLLLLSPSSKHIWGWFLCRINTLITRWISVFLSMEGLWGSFRQLHFWQTWRLNQVTSTTMAFLGFLPQIRSFKISRGGHLKTRRCKLRWLLQDWTWMKYDEHI